MIQGLSFNQSLYLVRDPNLYLMRKI